MGRYTTARMDFGRTAWDERGVAGGGMSINAAHLPKTQRRRRCIFARARGTRRALPTRAPVPRMAAPSPTYQHTHPSTTTTHTHTPGHCQTRDNSSLRCLCMSLSLSSCMCLLHTCWAWPAPLTFPWLCSPAPAWHFTLLHFMQKQTPASIWHG